MKYKPFIFWIYLFFCLSSVLFKTQGISWESFIAPKAQETLKFAFRIIGVNGERKQDESVLHLPDGSVIPQQPVGAELYMCRKLVKCIYPTTEHNGF